MEHPQATHSPSTAPVLATLDGTASNKLSGRVGVHGGHEILLDDVRVADDLGQGQYDDLVGPVTKVGLGLGDNKHACGIVDVCGVNRRLGDLRRVARVEELDAGHSLAGGADGVEGAGDGVDSTGAGVLVVDGIVLYETAHVAKGEEEVVGRFCTG